MTRPVIGGGKHQYDSLEQTITSSKVGWSDLVFFRDFRKVTGFCQSGMFLGVQFKKIGNFGRARARQGKVFVFKKSLGP